MSLCDGGGRVRGGDVVDVSRPPGTAADGRGGRGSKARGLGVPLQSRGAPRLYAGPGARPHRKLARTFGPYKCVV